MFDARLVAIGPRRERAYEESDWQDAIVVVERGELRLRCVSGGSRTFGAGSVLWLSGLRLRALENAGDGVLVLLAVSRRPPMSSEHGPRRYVRRPRTTQEDAMPKIHTEVTIDRPADDVWAVLGDLPNVDWVPGIAAARMDGDRRICTMEDGSEIHEEIELADEQRMFHYTQVVHPLLERSEGRVAVEPRDAGARVAWDAELEFADEAQEQQFMPMLEQGYGMAMESLKTYLERG
jgi:hypothetical protein